MVATVIGSAIDSKRKLEDEASIDNPKIAGSSSNISSNNQKLSSSNNSRDLLDKLQKGRRTDAR